MAAAALVLVPVSTQVSSLPGLAKRPSRLPSSSVIVFPWLFSCRMALDRMVSGAVQSGAEEAEGRPSRSLQLPDSRVQ